MSLEQKRSELQRDITKYSKLLQECKNELKDLKNSRQPKTTELYNGIGKFFSVKKMIGNYNYILGGDGRSKPWSETRKGVIVTIEIVDGIYLDRKQKDIIKEFVKDLHSPDHIKMG